MKKWKNSNSTTLIPIAMMFLVIGITFEESQWWKYTFMIISIILCVISLLFSLKNKNKEES